jgi:hypothetical protein
MRFASEFIMRHPIPMFSLGLKWVFAGVVMLCTSSLAWADARTRALTETYLPDLVKANHSPASPLAHIDEDRFFKTNAIVIALRITQVAHAKNDPSNECLRDRYQSDRATGSFPTQEKRAQAWIDDYLANFMGRHGELGRAEIDAFVQKTIETAQAGTPACRLVQNAFVDSWRYVQSFKK